MCTCQASPLAKTSRLVWKAHTRPKGRENKPVKAFLRHFGRVFGNSRHIGFVQRDQVMVRFDACWMDGFWKNGAAACHWEMGQYLIDIEKKKIQHTLPTQKDRRWRYPLLLGNLHDRFDGQQRTSRASQRTVRRDVNALFMAEIHDFLLRQVRMILDLVHRGHDRCLGQELFEVWLAVVGDANGLGLSRAHELFHVFPCLDVRMAVNYIA